MFGRGRVVGIRNVGAMEPLVNSFRKILTIQWVFVGKFPDFSPSFAEISSRACPLNTTNNESSRRFGIK